MRICHARPHQRPHSLTPRRRRCPLWISSARVMSASREFFALPEQDKSALSMAKSGRHWKGWFKLGGELTSGSPDHKEGLYLGDDLPHDHPDVLKGKIMHGPCQWPTLEGHPGEPTARAASRCLDRSCGCTHDLVCCCYTIIGLVSFVDCTLV